MMDFKQKNTVRKIVYSPAVVGIVVIIALYFLYSTWSIYRKMAQSRDDVDQAQQTLLTLAQKNQQLDGQISDLQTNQGVEKEIRAKFGVAKSDERMAVIVPDKDVEGVEASMHRSFWTRVKQFFGF